MPLHVFEPRYRELMRDCLAGDARFGIVLIERGSEVGGGDERSTGSAPGASSPGSAELPDGRWVLEIEGEALIAVEEWLPDDPYPVALVRDAASMPEHRETPPRWWAPPGNGSVGPGPCWPSRVARRHSLPTSPSTGEGTSSAASWQLCAAAPAERLRRAASPGGGRRARTSAPARRIDGRARARSAPHAAAPSEPNEPNANAE